MERIDCIVPSPLAQAGFQSELEVLGAGQFGKVFKAVWYHQSVAVKILKCTDLDEYNQAVKEISILRELR